MKGGKREKLFSVRKSDLRVDTFCSDGPGGQHQNKTETGVRITHIETGISAESREHKSQYQNKKVAFKKLADLLIAHFLQKEDPERYAAGKKVIRTYHEPNDMIVDHDTGLKYSYKNTFGKNKMEEVIERRAKEMASKVGIDKKL